ncbi:hypothetical protein GGR56DRAFT_428168 [Xylariaceae sp. FL0804]|nr:hypothetical protein GGR56DRAFT_428168 [Xylariaceae sp. FL0804]
MHVALTTFVYLVASARGWRRSIGRSTGRYMVRGSSAPCFLAPNQPRELWAPKDGSERAAQVLVTTVGKLLNVPMPTCLAYQLPHSHER